MLSVETVKKGTPVEFSEDFASKVCGLISEGLGLHKIEMKEGDADQVG